MCFNCKGIGTYVTRASSSKLDMHPYKAPICSAVTDWSFRPDVHGAHSKRCCVAARACIENVQLENLKTRDRAERHCVDGAQAIYKSLSLYKNRMNTRSVLHGCL